MSPENKVAIVTGAGSGIGKACAVALAQNGAAVVVADLNVESAQLTAARINAAGGVAQAQALDVAQRSSCAALVTQTTNAYGRIDVLVNCAGISVRQTVLEMSDEDWHRVIGVNLHGTFHITSAVAPVMVVQGGGSIILLASDRGIFGLAGGAHYSASKGAVIAYAKSLALELGANGITVNAINPGTTDTPMARGTLTDEEWQKRWSQDPLGRLSVPEDIAQIVLFLAGPASRFMTGQLISTRMRFG